MTDKTKSDAAVIDRARKLISQNELDRAEKELRQAREVARRANDPEEQASLTATLASIHAIRGDHESALSEYRRAEALQPGDIFARLITVRQLLRMGRNDEVLELCREILADRNLNGSDKHEALASMGKAFAGIDNVRARGCLEAARVAAQEDRVPAMIWDQLLAEKLAREGDGAGFTYLRVLSDAARSQGDDATVRAVAEILDELGHIQ